MERTRLALPAPSTAATERGWRRLRRGGRAELLAYLVLGVLVLAVLLLTDRGMIAPDTKPHLYLAPARTLRAALSAWRADPYLGQPNFDAGVAPVALGVGPQEHRELPARERQPEIGQVLVPALRSDEPFWRARCLRSIGRSLPSRGAGSDHRLGAGAFSGRSAWARAFRRHGAL